MSQISSGIEKKLVAGSCTCLPLCFLVVSIAKLFNPFMVYLVWGTLVVVSKGCWAMFTKEF